MRLYAVLLGGRTTGCHIELHDVVFAIGDSLEALYPNLVNQWFGDIKHKKLHIDSSVELKYVDGYEIVIVPKNTPIINDKKLYFANFGGYKPGFFGEIHEVNFYVASSRVEALARAKEELCVGLSEQHSDDHLVVDDIIELESVYGYSIHLEPTTQTCELKIESHYRKLSLPSILERAESLSTRS